MSHHPAAVEAGLVLLSRHAASTFPKGMVNLSSCREGLCWSMKPTDSLIFKKCNSLGLSLFKDSVDRDTSAQPKNQGRISILPKKSQEEVKRKPGFADEWKDPWIGAIWMGWNCWLQFPACWGKGWVRRNQISKGVKPADWLPTQYLARDLAHRYQTHLTSNCKDRQGGWLGTKSFRSNRTCDQTPTALFGNCAKQLFRGDNNWYLMEQPWELKLANRPAYSRCSSMWVPSKSRICTYNLSFRTLSPRLTKYFP